MKRSPLPPRRTPLKRGWLRPRRRLPAGLFVADVWREGLGPCAVCGSVFNVDGHHVIPKRVLKRLGFRDYLMDVRNRLPLCRDDHESHENRARPVPLELLPDSVWEFAADLGLVWYVERHYKASVPA